MIVLEYNIWVGDQCIKFVNRLSYCIHIYIGIVLKKTFVIRGIYCMFQEILVKTPLVDVIRDN